MQNISSNFQFPPGVRFHPSDEELIVYYLLNKLNSRPLPAAVIGEVELYNYNPWDLPNKAPFGDDEWFFFSPRDRKYPNGARPNRTAASGYWKATGTDKPILSSSSSSSSSAGSRIGVKKALVFYIGKPPNGVKTDWIMIEYRIPDTLINIRPQRSKISMRLDDWVLCRIRQKGHNNNNMSKNTWDVPYSPRKHLVGGGDNLRKNSDNMNICSNYFLAKDCHLLANLLANDQDFLPPTISTVTTTTSQGQSKSCNSNGKKCDESYLHGLKITMESHDLVRDHDQDQVISSYNSEISSSIMNLQQGKRQSSDDGYGYGYGYVSNSYHHLIKPMNSKNYDIDNLLSNGNNMVAAKVSSSCFLNQDLSRGGGDEFKHNNLSNSISIMNLVQELDMSTFAEKFIQ